MKNLGMTLILTLAAMSAEAAKLPGKDDLSSLVPHAGFYSRSLITDVEDRNTTSLCAHIVKLELQVNVAEKNVTVILTSADQNENLTSATQVVKVGAASLSVWDAVNGVRVYSVNGVKGGNVVTFERKDVSWLGHKGKWEVYENAIEFTPGKVKIGFCTFRRI